MEVKLNCLLLLIKQLLTKTCFLCENSYDAFKCLITYFIAGKDYFVQDKNTEFHSCWASN